MASDETPDGGGEDIVRVLRIYEFIGPRSAVERLVSMSIHGTNAVGTATAGTVRITGLTLTEYPERLIAARGSDE